MCYLSYFRNKFEKWKNFLDNGSKKSKQLNQERDKEDKECSSEEEDSNKKGRMPTGDIKKMLYNWEEFQSLATKWHPNSWNEQTLCLGWSQVCESL